MQFDGVVVLLPELVFCIVRVALAGALKHPEHPCVATFLRVFFDSAEDFFGRVALQVAQVRGQRGFYHAYF